MPDAENQSLNKLKMLNNYSSCLDNGIICSKPQKNNGFLVEFNEDGAPIDCHKVIIERIYIYSYIIFCSVYKISFSL